MEKRIRVGIRGISGILGSRLALAIARQSDMEVVVGIARNDTTLARVLRLESLLREQGSTLATTLGLDEPHDVVDCVNHEHSPIRFVAADQFPLHELCDILVDATSPGVSKKFAQEYQGSPIPVILQSSEFPRGTLIAPPLNLPANGNLWRQGDCCLSGLLPLLALFNNDIVTGRINLLTQYPRLLNDFPTDQRIQATYRCPGLARQLEQQLTMLFDSTAFSVDVLQVPGHDYYTATIDLELKRSFSGEELRALLCNVPRVLLADNSINSTYEIDHHLREPLRAIGKELATIVVYGSSLYPAIKCQARRIRFQATIYSRLIAVLANIDVIRILAREIPSAEAMRQTDRNMLIKTTVL